MKVLKILVLVVFVALGLTGNAKAEEVTTAGIMRMEEEFLAGDLLRISVIADEMQEPVLGFAFDLVFEEKKLEFLKYQPGEFLELGGDPFYLVKAQDGRVIFGETLRKDDGFPVGTGVVAEFYFQILEESGDFAFLFRNGVVSTLDSVRQDLEKIEWRDAIFKRGGSNIFQDKYLGIELGGIDSGVSDYLKMSGIVLAATALAVLIVRVFKLSKMPRKPV